jgi:hypothetical protein
VTRLSPADGNVIAAFFSTLFRPSAVHFIMILTEMQALKSKYESRR